MKKILSLLLVSALLLTALMVLGTVTGVLLSMR